MGSTLSILNPEVKDDIIICGKSEVLVEIAEKVAPKMSRLATWVPTPVPEVPRSSMKVVRLNLKEQKQLEETSFWCQWNIGIGLQKKWLLVAHISGLIFSIWVCTDVLSNFRREQGKIATPSYFRKTLAQHTDHLTEEFCCPSMPKLGTNFKKYDLKSKVGARAIGKRKVFHLLK